MTVHEVGVELDRILNGVVDLLSRETGPGNSFEQAALEWQRIIKSDYNYAGIAARRAALIFALHTLKPVRTYFAKKEPELLLDLELRVLPVAVPAFINGMAQRPDSLVVMVSTLTSMWKEDMGNGAHMSEPVGVLHEGSD